MKNDKRLSYNDDRSSNGEKKDNNYKRNKRSFGSLTDFEEIGKQQQII
jgi:hypothetical protein